MRKQRCILCKAERTKNDWKWHQAILGIASDSENKNPTAFLLLNSNCALHCKSRKTKKQVQVLKVYCHAKLYSVLFSLWQKKSTSVSDHKEWVGWDTGESQHKDFVKTKTAQQSCSSSQEANRNLHIFHKNKEYWIFNQDGQTVKMFLTVLKWHFKLMLWLCYTEVFFLPPSFLSQGTMKVKFKTQQLFLSEQKCLAHMNIELTHCTVFQVLEENCAVDIL